MSKEKHLRSHMPLSIEFHGWCWLDKDKNKWNFINTPVDSGALNKRIFWKTGGLMYECIVIEWSDEEGWYLEGWDLESDTEFLQIHLRSLDANARRMYLACEQDGTPLPDNTKQKHWYP